MDDRTKIAALLGLALCGASPAAPAEDHPAGSALEVLQATPSRIQEFLGRHLVAKRRKRPDWLLEQSQDSIDPQPHPGAGSAQLVLQEDRNDGMDLLTLRHPLGENGAWRAYAGAGLSQAVYFEDERGVPTLISRSSRERSLGPAAELGAELRVSASLLLQADLRWVDLANDAVLLRSKDGLVGADALWLGVSLGWKFR